MPHLVILYTPNLDGQIAAGAKPYFEAALARDPGGLTLQIDDSAGQVYDGKFSTLHPLFNKP